MKLIECFYCLGTKSVWNNKIKEFEICPACSGEGVIQVPEEEEEVQEFPEEDTEIFDEFKHSKEEDSL